jgi:putative membrane protein insertion efficiency factor
MACKVCGKQDLTINEKMRAGGPTCDKCFAEREPGSLDSQAAGATPREERQKTTKTISEIKYTCNVCGKVWHVSTADQLAELGKASLCCGGCIPAGATMKDLDRCPECKSGNVTQERVEYQVPRASLTRPWRRGPAERVLVSLLRGYQRFASPLVARYVHCRFYPTCSSYAVTVIRKHGWFAGSIRAARRLARCRPGNHTSCLDLP